MQIVILHSDWLKRVDREGGSVPTISHNISYIINNLEHFTYDNDGDLILKHDDYKHMLPSQKWINTHNTVAYIGKAAIKRVINTKEK